MRGLIIISGITCGCCHRLNVEVQTVAVTCRVNLESERVFQKWHQTNCMDTVRDNPKTSESDVSGSD